MPPFPHIDAGPALKIETPRLERKLALLETWSWWLWTMSLCVLLVVCIAVPRNLRFPLGGVAAIMAIAIYEQVIANRLRKGLTRRTQNILNRKAARLERLSILDPLTGLFNRRFAMEHMPLEIARAERMQYPLTLLMLDLDNFKEINDNYGHEAGDEALRAFARHLKRAVRNADLVVRMGGDEFLVLFPECDLEQVQTPLSRMLGCIAKFAEITIPITFSAGLLQHVAGNKQNDLLRRVDEEMYRNKRRRRLAV